MSQFLRIWAPRLFGIVAIALLPWALWLVKTLPSSHRSDNWDLAWGGFDVLIAVALLGTAITAARRSPLLPISAAAAGTLLVVDAWFDILTSHSGGEREAAVLLAVLGELPLAALAFWIALDGERFYAALGQRRRREEPPLQTPSPANPRAHRT
jgi:hypothetical protein